MMKKPFCQLSSLFLVALAATTGLGLTSAQTLDKMRLGYSGTGFNISKAEIAQRTG